MSRIAWIATDGKEGPLRDWVRRRLGSVDHELRVMEVGVKLFDLTKRWHGLGALERKLLALGAIVHDVGRVNGDEGHAELGAKMVMEGAHLPLGEAERRRIAYLTRYHRGRVPEAGAEEFLDHDHATEGEGMRVLLGLLRAADSLDSRSIDPPRLVMSVRDRRLTIQGYVEMDGAEARETFGRPKKMRLLEEMLGCDVRTEWFSTEGLALVA